MLTCLKPVFYRCNDGMEANEEVPWRISGLTQKAKGLYNVI